MNEPRAIEPAIAALYKHWCVADSVKATIAIDIEAPSPGFSPEIEQLGQMHSAFMRLSVFYSLLFVVVEGYRGVGVSDPAVEEMLADEERVKMLRRFRNANFHYQEDPFSKKLMEFLEREDGPAWTRALHAAFETFFRSRLPIDEMVAAFTSGNDDREPKSG